MNLAKRISTLLMLLSFTPTWAQVDGDPEAISPKEAITKVFEVLSKQEGRLPASADSTNVLLQKGAWEALAYVNAAGKDSLTKADLQEAVPDYYRFYKNQLLLKLINQDNYNEYGTEASVPYFCNGKVISILDPDTGAAKDKWTILYLDAYYLALDYGDLRVFFVQTNPQE